MPRVRASYQPLPDCHRVLRERRLHPCDKSAGQQQGENPGVLTACFCVASCWERSPCGLLGFSGHGRIPLPIRTFQRGHCTGGYYGLVLLPSLSVCIFPCPCFYKPREHMFHHYTLLINGLPGRRDYGPVFVFCCFFPHCFLPFAI